MEATATVGSVTRWLGATVILVLAVCLGFAIAHVGRGDAPETRASEEQPRAPVAVAALGRLEPKHGLIVVAGPSRLSVVIDELLVEETDEVEEGQVLAVLDTLPIHEATVARLEAELSTARLELERNEELLEKGAISISDLDAMRLLVSATEAELAGARAECQLDRVRAPSRGQVIEIHAREGERVGPRGILELGRTDAMYAIAEVYETDIPRVEIGQSARVSSPALPTPLEGIVERIHLKIGKLDVVGADPAARTDARVVEVEIRLLEGEAAAALTNLQVEIRFEP